MEMLSPEPSGSSAHRLRQGFTLIEMLVVIAIVGVLASLLVPAGNRVIEQAKSGKCLSNLRQIAVGLNNYANEHDGKFPIYWGGPDGTWVEATVPYLGNQVGSRKDVWVCPASPLPMRDIPGSIWVYTYSIHGRLSTAESDPNASEHVPQLRRFSVERPSDLILVADSPQNPNNHNLPDLALWNPNWAFWGDVEAKDLDKPVEAKYENQMGNLSYHHPGNTANAVMVDGSAKAIKRGDLKLRNIMAKSK